MKSVTEICSCIAYSGQDLTGENSRRQLKKSKDHSLMKNSRNCVEEQEAMEPYEVGQEMQATSHKSYQIKWVSIHLWQVLHQTFNSAQDQHINFCLLDRIPF